MTLPNHAFSNSHKASGRDVAGSSAREREKTSDDSRNGDSQVVRSAGYPAASHRCNAGYTTPVIGLPTLDRPLSSERDSRPISLTSGVLALAIEKDRRISHRRLT